MIFFAIPGDLGAPTGGYVYARRLITEWAKAGTGCATLPLPGSFPHPGRTDLAKVRAVFARLPSRLLVDGLAYGAFDERLAADIGPRCTVLLHHPLCDETGLSEADSAGLFETEKTALSYARTVVVTSAATARDVIGRFGVAADRVHVAEPGLDRSEPAPLDGNPPRLLAVGSVTPRKGYRDLVAALAGCKSLEWTCQIVGALDRDTDEVAALRAEIADAGLEARIALVGAMEREALNAAYRGADLLLAPSYHEGYGMAVAEAMAHGLPVLTTRAGALPETAPCARFVDAGDRDALRAALAELLSAPDLRREMGRESRRIAESRPTWQETAARVGALV